MRREWGQAHDVLADAKLRQKYDRELADAERAEMARKAYEEDPDSMEGLIMACSRCEQRGIANGGHLVLPTTRPLQKARYCALHKEYSPFPFLKHPPFFGPSDLLVGPPGPLLGLAGGEGQSANLPMSFQGAVFFLRGPFLSSWGLCVPFQRCGAAVCLWMTHRMLDGPFSRGYKAAGLNL